MEGVREQEPRLNSQVRGRVGRSTLGTVRSDPKDACGKKLNHKVKAPLWGVATLSPVSGTCPGHTVRWEK